MHFHYHNHRTRVQVCNNSVQPRLVRMLLIPNLAFRPSLATPTLLVYLHMTNHVSWSPISPPYQFLGPQEHCNRSQQALNKMKDTDSKHFCPVRSFGMFDILNEVIFLSLPCTKPWICYSIDETNQSGGSTYHGRNIIILSSQRKAHWSNKKHHRDAGSTYTIEQPDLRCLFCLAISFLLGG